MHRGNFCPTEILYFPVDSLELGCYGYFYYRKELEKEEEAENQKKDTRNRDWMGQDIGEAFQLMIDKLKV